MADSALILIDFSSLSTNLNTYLNKVSAYLNDPSQPLPNTSALIDAITSDNIITHATLNQQSSNLSDHGCVVAAIDRVFALQREVSLRGSLKSDFYAAAAAELTSEAESNTSYVGFATNTMRGRNATI